MRRQRTAWLVLILVALLHTLFTLWRGSFAPQLSAYASPAPVQSAGPDARQNTVAAPAHGYIEASFAARMRALRPTILAAAARHNHPAVSGLSDTQFAATMAQLLYNEHNGWFEDEVPLIRQLTPLYQQVQQGANETGLGSNFSVWPSNLRPSVALEILAREVPLPAGKGALAVPISVMGSSINQHVYPSRRALLAAITAELADERLAVEYLAANLERGVYRARYEGAPITWRTLAAWHNGGITLPIDIAANTRTDGYVKRAALYLAAAHELIEGAYARGR
ncbi:MAG: hypothetical protein H7Y32_09725 [Chloroflexales bacterium]|nr:hypothetical protein [Chloroflexales bacterium]